MPPKAKNPEEFALEKQKIIDAAILLMKKTGLSGMSMRKLAQSLNMSATNLYNYFENKDEIYLHIRINSFNLLYDRLTEAQAEKSEAFEKLEAYLRAFIRFGVLHESRYEIMLSTADPKALDYVDTPLEELANEEKDNAMRTYNLLCDILEELAFNQDKDLIWTTAGRIIAEMHGAIHLYHTHILRETFNEPELIFESVINHILEQFKQ